MGVVEREICAAPKSGGAVFDAARAGSVPNGGEGENASLAKVAFFAMIRATSDARTYV